MFRHAHPAMRAALAGVGLPLLAHTVLAQPAPAPQPFEPAGATILAQAITPAAAASAAGDARLPSVVVTGEREATGSRGYLPVQASTGGNKLDLTVREQPNVVHIVPRESFEDRGALTVHEALETVAGIRPVSPAYTSGSGGIRSRGFETQDVFINGARLGAFGHPLDTANIQQLEVLKGPASIQYGLVDPGGALNLVTKRPVVTPLLRARAIAGSFDTYRAELDMGGAIGPDRRLLTRLNLAAETNEEHREFDRTKRFFIAPAATVQLAEGTVLDLELNYLRNRFRFNRGLTPHPFILDLPFNRSLGEPNQPLSTNESVNLFWNLEHRLGDSGWALRQRLAYLRNDGDVYEVNGGVSDPNAQGEIERSFFYSFQEDRYWTVQHELAGEFETGGVRHKALFGVEFAKTDFGYGFYGPDAAGQMPALDPFDPQYGGYDFPPRSELTAGSPPEHYGNRVSAIYADWHATFSPQWRLLAGLRYDRTRGFYEAIDGSVDYGSARSKGVSPRVGFVWTPQPALDLFANYSTGFVPQIFSDGAGNLFTEPEESRQLEAGVRYEIVPERLRATAAAFTITKKNVQVPDPNDPTGQGSVLSGEQKSSGFELELAGAVTPRWDVTAGFARVNARVTEDSELANIGTPLVDAPRNHLALFTKYRLSGAAQDWWLGYGAARVSERVSSSANAEFLLPAYTRHDLALGFERGPLAAQLNLGNVSDERIYYTHGNNIHLQPGRNLRAALSYAFR